MKKFFKKYKKIFGLLMLILTIVFFFFWETVGRQELLYTDVIILNTDVKQGDLITSDLISYSKCENSLIIDGALLDPNLIIGKEAIQFIPKNLLLREEYFDYAEIVLNDGEYVFKLPQDWIASYPNTLRRKDKVFFYPVQMGKTTKEPISFTYIAYVKDGANREVENINAENRLVGTSNIESIEIVANDELLSLLTKYINDGYKIAILYN